MTKAEIRSVIAALRPPAEAFARAQAKGWLTLDDEVGWYVSTPDLEPAAPTNPDQLSLDEI